MRRPRATPSLTSSGSIPNSSGRLPFWISAIDSAVISTRLALEDALVVELLHPHRALGGGIDAELAEHALVEVVLDDLHVPARVLEDVHWAGVLELLRDVRLVADLRIDLDIDEQARHQTAPPLPSLCLTRSGISAISSATVMPASFSRAIFSAAVSALPSTIVPAWPKLIPGISSMKRPAMNATIGSPESCSVTHRASSASIRPPGSV